MQPVPKDPWKVKRLSVKGSCKGTVVLVHGLFLFGFYLTPLAWRFVRNGYDVCVCDYPTRRYGILEHSEAFSSLLDTLALDARGHINLVTHSLGGVIARVTLASLEGDGIFTNLTPGRIGRTVMLAPPNKGSDVAKSISLMFPSWAGDFAKPLPELSSDPASPVNSLPIPNSFEIGILAGSCDIEVAAPYTELASASAWKLLRSDHTLMPFYPHVFRETLHFLEKGHFMA